MYFWWVLSMYFSILNIYFLYFLSTFLYLTCTFCNLRAILYVQFTLFLYSVYFFCTYLNFDNKSSLSWQSTHSSPWRSGRRSIWWCWRLCRLYWTSCPEIQINIRFQSYKRQFIYKIYINRMVKMWKNKKKIISILWM